MSRTGSPLKWHGGKRYLAEWIISHMPPHLHYVEPFFGGGAVLFARDIFRDWAAESPTAKLPAKDRGCSEVANDVNAELTNFWFVMQDDEWFAEFKRIVEVTPFSEREFVDAVKWDSEDPVERAVAFFIRYRQSRQGLGRDFATMSRTRTRRRMNEQASSWWSVVDGLDDARERLKRVVILNRDARDIIRQQDGEQTLFYCDPPYVHETRTATNAYEFEMTVEDHERLLTTLSTIDGKFLLSGYRCELYDTFAESHAWRRVDREIDNKASSKSTKPKKVESLWINYGSRQSDR